MASATPKPASSDRPSTRTERKSTSGDSESPPPARLSRPAPALTPVSQPIFPRTALPDDLRAQGVFVNLEGDYDYLGDGYYRSMEAEHEGLVAIPSPAEALDAYVVPLALCKAAAAGIEVPPWEIVNDSTFGFEPPVLLYPINPFQTTGQLIADASMMNESITRMTVNPPIVPKADESRIRLWQDTLIDFSIYSEEQMLLSL